MAVPVTELTVVGPETRFNFLNSKLTLYGILRTARTGRATVGDILREGPNQGTYNLALSRFNVGECSIHITQFQRVQGLAD